MVKRELAAGEYRIDDDRLDAATEGLAWDAYADEDPELGCGAWDDADQT